MKTLIWSRKESTELDVGDISLEELRHARHLLVELGYVSEESFMRQLTGTAIDRTIPEYLPRFAFGIPTRILDSLNAAIEAKQQGETKSATEVIQEAMIPITTNGTTRLVPKDEPVFLLRGQDKLAAATVEYWINLARQEGVNPATIETAKAHVEKIKAWPVKKLPD